MSRPTYVFSTIQSSILLIPLVALGCDSRGEVDTGQTALSSLPGSQFEIDDDANLVVDTPGLSDWASVEDDKNDDMPSGQLDNSYKGGSKEDDLCPGIDDGSIPNNKSDLKTFGVYKEPGDPGFMHLFWSRVQDPTGTTLMDFEFNQSSEDCGNGVNPVRTVDDLLIEYRLKNGGSTATIRARLWTGTAWGDEVILSDVGAATGTINDSAIAAEDSDGLGALDPRTFGEASIDLNYIFDENKCTSFGSAFVKSRSSVPFTAALKDFIAPIPVDITNCGKVIIRKQTDPDGLTDVFDFTHTLQTDPAEPGSTFQLADDGAKEFTNVLFGNGYTVTESALAPGFELTDIDCSDSSGVVPAVNITTSTVTFDIDEDSDVVDCTFTNQAKGDIIVEKVTNDGQGAFSFASSALGGFSLTTTGAGQAGKDSITFGDRDPGTYDVSESVPAGWTLVSATCDDGSSPGAIDLDAGETVTCTFVNERNRGAVDIVKMRKHAADGPGPHPQAGVTFLVSGGELAGPVPVVTGANGHACLDGLVLSSFVGNYSVTEVLPPGYAPDGDLAKPVTVSAPAECPSGNQVSFGNTPLTNLSVRVDSQVDGGTASTITCDSALPVQTNAVGDGQLDLTNLLPGTYNCQILIDP